MQLFLDSANLTTIRDTLAVLPLDGVTTNPTIIARDMPDYMSLGAELKLIRELCGERLVFAQVTSEDADGMISDAHEIVRAVGGRVSIKLPAIPSGFTAAMKLADEGISVTVTAVYTTSQAILAAKCGADYVAPYISHIDNLSLDGPAVAVQMSDMLKLHGFGTTVLAASFRTASQVERVIAGGVGAVTVTADMLGLLMEHPGSRNEVDKFNESWYKRFDKPICEMLTVNATI